MESSFEQKLHLSRTVIDSQFFFDHKLLHCAFELGVGVFLARNVPMVAMVNSFPFVVCFARDEIQIAYLINCLPGLLDQEVPFLPDVCWVGWGLIFVCHRGEIKVG